MKSFEDAKETAKNAALQDKQKTFMNAYIDSLYQKASVKKNMELLGQ